MCFYLALHLASCLECGTRPTGLVAVECEVASMFMKAPRDFPGVSGAQNVQ